MVIVVLNKISAILIPQMRGGWSPAWPVTFRITVACDGLRGRHFFPRTGTSQIFPIIPASYLFCCANSFPARSLRCT